MGVGAVTVRLLVDPVLALVFPENCPVCAVGLAHPSRGPLCEACWRDLPRHAGPLCGCGAPLTCPAPCGRCRRGLQPLRRGASLGPFEAGLRAAIHELKYRGRRRVAARLADALVATDAVAALLTRDAVLVPVPLHPRRLRTRGFNQAELLADELARRSSLAVSARALVRRKETAPQTGLNAVERRRNVAGAFAVRRRSSVQGRVVVLVDDVQTTGATLRACARALLDGGAAEVRMVTAARVD